MLEHNDMVDCTEQCVCVRVCVYVEACMRDRESGIYEKAVCVFVYMCVCMSVCVCVCGISLLLTTNRVCWGFRLQNSHSQNSNF